MVTETDIDDFGDIGQFTRTLEVLCAGIGISAWMIMCNINRMRTPTQRLLEDFARMHQRCIRRSARNQKRFTYGSAVCIQRQHKNVLLFVINSEASSKKSVSGISVDNPFLTKIAWRKTLTAPPQFKRRRKFKAFHLAESSDPRSGIPFVVFLYTREY